MELPHRDRLPAPRLVLVLAGVTAVVSAVSIAVIDQPVARAIAPHEASSLWDRGINLLEYAIGLPVFKLLSAVLLVLAMIVTTFVSRLRIYAPLFTLLAGTHLITRLAMIYLKEWTGRLRPHEWLELGGDTFLRDGGLSFPSGHVVLFASLVIPLVVVYQRLRPLLVIPVFVSAARIAVGAHFISDTTAAIALVLLVTWGIAWVVRPCGPAPRRASPPGSAPLP
ncbi:MAG: phosphatase PAP2 family protein [Kofleriaceae bacterium]